MKIFKALYGLSLFGSAMWFTPMPFKLVLIVMAAAIFFYELGTRLEWK